MLRSRTPSTAGSATRTARTAPAIAAVLVVAGGAVTAVGMPVAAADGCKDIEVVFARGTSEPAGLGRVGTALVDSLRPLVKGKSIGTYAVKYPATWDFRGVATGANDASARVQSTAANCPATKIVLGGYSQGAAVIDVITTSPVAGLGFKAPMPRAVAENIAAVTVFGNPSTRIGQPLTMMSPLYGAKTADLCNTKDPICSQGNDFNSHTRYPESGLVGLGAQWVAKHVLTPAPRAAA